MLSPHRILLMIPAADNVLHLVQVDIRTGEIREHQRMFDQEHRPGPTETED